MNDATLLELFGLAITDAVRESIDRTLADSTITAQVFGTVVTEPDADGVAIVHVDGDPPDITAPAIATGLSAFSGDRVAMLSGKTLVLIGQFGGVSGTVGVDLSSYVRFDQLPAPPPLYREHSFPMPAAAEASTSVASAVWVPEAMVNVVLIPEDPPTGSSMIFNLQFDGVEVLATDIVVPVGATAGEPIDYAGVFNVPTLVPPGPGASKLQGVCSQADSNNVGGRLMFSVMTERLV